MKRYSTEQVAKILDVSPSTVRLYGKKLEQLGRTFNKNNDAREFTSDDVEVIKCAKSYYRSAKGTMMKALHYALIEREKGEVIAHQEVDKLYTSRISEFDLIKNDLMAEMEDTITKAVDEAVSRNVKELIRKLGGNKNEL